MSEASISVDDPAALLALFGPRDQHLRRIREELDVRISARNGRIIVEGSEQPVAQATGILEQLRQVLDQHGSVDTAEVEKALSLIKGNGHTETIELPPFDVFNAARKIQPKTTGQARYLRAILDHEIVIAAGPAGTGKTYLAVAAAVSALKQERVRRIVLVRPAVEAGESLGYLPGDMLAKINPYLRPLLDSLREMMDYEMMKRFM